MAVVVRRDFPAFMADNMKMIFDEATGDLQEEFDQIFNIKTSDRAFETEAGFVGLGAPALTAELEGPRYDAPKQGRFITYMHNKFSLAVAISYEAKEDDRYGKIAPSIIPETATSFKVERNQQAADVLNNAFDLVGYEPDKVPLVSDVHPVIRPTGVFLSNKLSLPLSIAGLQAARAKLRKNRTESNKIKPLVAHFLVVGPSLESLAEELTMSTQKPVGFTAPTTAAPNEINLPSIRRLVPVVMNYLRDDGTYFVMTAKEMLRLVWYERKKLYRKTIQDDEQEAVKLIAFGRWSVGFSDWRGITGYEGS